MLFVNPANRQNFLLIIRPQINRISIASHVKMYEVE